MKNVDNNPSKHHIKVCFVVTLSARHKRIRSFCHQQTSSHCQNIFSHGRYYFIVKLFILFNITKHLGHVVIMPKCRNFGNALLPVIVFNKTFIIFEPYVVQHHV